MRKAVAALSFLLVFTACTMVRAQDAAEVQRERIDAQIARFPVDTSGARRVFFLGFAGYGEERVFAEEIKLAAQRVGEKYGSSARTVLLLNDRRDLATYPLASVSSLRYTLKALAAVMNRDEDVLFLALSSHGYKRAALSIVNTGMSESALGPNALAGMLHESGIRWRVIVISACYSGGFISALADNHTIVVTAASKSRTSFGCSDDRDLTYFGEAFYRDSLPGARNLRAAFDAARREIMRREKEEHFTPSQPQAYFGPLMESKMDEMNAAPH